MRDGYQKSEVGNRGAAMWRRGILRHLPLLLGAVLMLFPLWWMLVVSLETEQRAGMAMLGGDVVQVWPEDPQWHNYSDAMREVGSTPWVSFLDALANSIVVTVSVIIGTVLSCSLVGFAFARVRFRGRGGMFLLMLATMMLPAQVTMIPLFLLFRSMGWVDTLLPLIVPAFFGSAFNIFLYRQFIAGIPEALLEAGRLDGLGWGGDFLKRLRLAPPAPKTGPADNLDQISNSERRWRVPLREPARLRRGPAFL